MLKSWRRPDHALSLEARAEALQQSGRVVRPLLTSVPVLIMSTVEEIDDNCHFLVVVVIGPAVTIFLASGLLNSSVADPSAVWCWIAAAGTFLALYIQYYWLYCAWRSGLYLHKRGRKWPEGNDKDPAF
jgi:hypothetical protein